MTAAPPRIITRAEGATLTDSQGRQLLDAQAGLWGITLGHGRPELAETAVRHMGSLPVATATVRPADLALDDLAHVLTDLTPGHLNRVVFCNGAAEAREAAVRLVRHARRRQDRPCRKIAVVGPSAELSGHGFLTVPVPGTNGDADPEALGAAAIDTLAARLADMEPGAVGAILVEPILATQGMVVPPQSWWHGLRDLCDRRDILLIADEAVCGLGRTGAWFGCDAEHIQADIMVVGRALTSAHLPLGAVVVADRLAEALDDFARPPGAHPVAAAVAMTALDLLRRERLIDMVADVTGPRLQHSLTEALAGRPGVRAVRGHGLMAGVVLADATAAERVVAQAGDRGALFARHDDTVVIAPPLIITPNDIDALVTTLAATLPSEPD